MIARVFPRRTNATPTDRYSFHTEPDWFIPDDITEVHVSVTFTWDLRRAEYLAKEWEHIAPVTIGGPATGMRGNGFEPGRYLKPGYVITSRGCPNKCWFCDVWWREGDIRELPIRDGWNVLDDNLLACSDDHILSVFIMLFEQKAQGHRILFTGGLEAARLQPWHIATLHGLRPGRIYFAYDTADDLEPLREAGRLLLAVGFTRASHVLMCYVLIGYPGDTVEAAEKRLRETIDAGFMPFAMLYRNETGEQDREWMRFKRQWVKPAIIAGRMKEAG